jgi:RimJ/RimL family protein N-acetyltransferase
MTVYNALEWLRLHMALECIEVDAQGDLIRLPCEDPDDIHRLYIARHGDRYHVYFRHDVPEEVRTALRSLSDEELFLEHDRVKSIFTQYSAPVEGMHIGRSYVHPTLPVVPDQPEITYFADQDRCALLHDEVMVAQCMSIRADAQSAEAYVETHPDFRRQGYGKIVTTAWAHRVVTSGRLPFYSHRITNTASQKLAESLGFVWFIDDVGYE